MIKDIDPTALTNMRATFKEALDLIAKIDGAVAAGDDAQVIETMGFDTLRRPAVLNQLDLVWFDLFKGTKDAVAVPVEVGPEEEQVIPGTVEL